MSEALEYLEKHMGDDDPHVKLVSVERVPHFQRLSGHNVGLGWPAYTYGARLSREPGAELLIEWIPVHRGQGLADQIRHCNIYYRVQGLKDPDQVFHTGLGGFLGPESPVLQEYRRLCAIEKARAEIAAGKVAKKRLAELLAAAPTNS